MAKYPIFLQFAASIVTTSLLGLTFVSQPLYAIDENFDNSSTFNWYDLWDTSSTQATRTFTNVNGSGVDVTVEYSTNQRWQQDQNHNGLNLYDNYAPQKHSLNDSHDLWIYHGILRVTNNPHDKGNDSAWVKMTFSTPVTIEQLWAGSLSVIGDRREWIKVSAYSSNSVDINNLSASSNELVSPSKVDDYQDFFNTTCNHTTYSDNAAGHECNLAGADDPSLIGILNNADGSVTLKGLGSQSSNEYGRAFFEYNTPVQTIIFEHYATDIDSNTQRNPDYTSVAISPELTFTDASSVPTTTFVD
ncbi:MAG: hypothetical protein QNJ55_07250 [Xenococcus sp. MO_188.B8]|nr:hypothetical protein [Xenococcus sp. MO_188.B8]